eukprot:TRINITY_DN46_c0_g4_i1.p1 TRINITY_DN46_c0_g4~~TRINITY_DN46_c0_g4_i1.p1  ORF type:complete len:433 (+),score=48.26 TRINITY_DN46_c0_g4_i1:1384-2682(+)
MAILKHANSLCMSTVLFIVLTSFSVKAQTDNSSTMIENSSLRVSGFGTLGLTHTDAPEDWGFRREISQPANDGGTRADIDSRVGLQLNYSPSHQFELVAQIIATRRSSYAPLSDSLEWAFAAYRPTPDITLRVGRLNIDAFLLANYRHVGFAYRFVRPPVDFYGSLPHSLDGIDISKDFQNKESLWRVKAYSGRSHSGDLSVDGRTQIQPVYGLTVTRENSGLTLRAGIAYATLDETASSLNPLIDGLDSLSNIPLPTVTQEVESIKDRLTTDGNRIIYHSFSANYEVGDWLWTLEATKVTGAPLVRMFAGYAGVGKRFGAVTLFGTISTISTPDLPFQTPDWATQLTPAIGIQGAQEAQMVAAYSAYAINSAGANQQTYSIGGRWDFSSNMALKLQHDHINIDEYGGRLWTNSSLESGSADVTSVSVDFIF